MSDTARRRKLPPRPPLVEDVYDLIIEALVSNEIEPGSPFNIDGFARQLGVSPTPVREALVRVEAEGLVVKMPNRGFIAAPLLSRDKVRQLTEARVLLEPWAAARATQLAASADSERLRALAKYGPPPADEDVLYREDMQTDAAFHAAIWELSGNEVLRDGLTRLHCHRHLYRLGYTAELRRVSEAEHLQIADAIADGDVEAAELAMRAHVSTADTRIHNHMRRNQEVAVEYTTLGQTGMTVSRIGFGCAGLGNEYGGVTDDDATAVVRHAIDTGITYFDTSTYYGRRLSEERLGRALAGHRDQIVLATKGGRFDAPLETGFDFSYNGVIEMCEASLRRLRTDFIDVYQLHDIEFGDKEEVFSEAMRALIDLKAAGKVRHIGVTGYPLPLLAEAVEKFPLDVVLSYSRYNLMDRSMQEQLVPVAQRNGTAVINASILNMGLLSERGPQEWHPASERVKAVAARVREYCHNAGISISALATQFALANDDVSVTLLGSSNIATLDSSLVAAGEPMDMALLAEVEAVIGHESLNAPWGSGRPEHWELAVDRS